MCTKDLGLISELANSLEVPLELGATATQSFRRAEELYGGDSPELSDVRYLQELPGISLQSDAKAEGRAPGGA